MAELSKTQAAEIVQWHLKKLEAIGDQIGGSGHLAHRSLTKLVLEDLSYSSFGMEVQFSYDIQTESEFTIYPDNPPVEAEKKRSLLIDQKLLDEYESEMKKSREKRESDGRRFLDSLNW